MNLIDYTLLAYLNQIADKHPILTKVVLQVYASELKTMFIVALIWWVWFDERDPADQEVVRQKIVSGLAGSLVCIAVIRLMVVLLPFRIRPLADPLNGLHFPVAPGDWVRWSSFPSDNATLFFMLTVVLFGISRMLGSLALVDTVFLICLPRVFVGVHHPSDILGGAVMGIAAGYLFCSERVRILVSRPTLHWMRAHPASFYASAFTVTYLFAQVFWPALSVLMGLKRFVQLLLK